MFGWVFGRDVSTHSFCSRFIMTVVWLMGIFFICKVEMFILIEVSIFYDSFMTLLGTLPNFS